MVCTCIGRYNMSPVELIIQAYMVALCLIFIFTAVIATLHLLLGLCIYKFFKFINKNNKGDYL